MYVYNVHSVLINNLGKRQVCFNLNTLNKKFHIIAYSNIHTYTLRTYYIYTQRIALRAILPAKLIGKEHLVALDDDRKAETSKFVMKRVNTLTCYAERLSR